MLHESAKAYIRSLSTEELVAYGTDWKSGHTPEAIQFACDEALSRGIPSHDEAAVLRSASVAKEKADSEAKRRREFARNAPAHLAASGAMFGICLAQAIFWAGLLHGAFLGIGFVSVMILAFVFAVIGYIFGKMMQWAARAGRARG